MDEIRLYCGVSGEVVRHFIRFKTFIIAIPMALACLSLALFSYFLNGTIDAFYITYLVLIISVLFSAIFTGFFAMAAEQGDHTGGFFSYELNASYLFSYVLRYIVFNLFWFIPALLITNYLIHLNNILELLFSLRFGVGLWGMVEIWYVILIVLAFFGPLISPLLAIYTQSLHEVLSLKPWQWLFERAADLPAYFAQIVGGMVLFFMKYFIPLSILKILSFKISLKFGIYVDQAISFLPVLILPIILGRLSGAFVALDEDKIELNSTGAPAANAYFVQEQKKIYEQLLKTLEKMPPSELEMMENTALNAEPNIYQALVLSYLFKKNQKIEQALPQAQKTIIQCLKEGLGYDAILLFRYYIKERTALKLSPEQLIELADYSALHNNYSDAAWCYIMATVQLPEEQKLGVQKKFLHMVDIARQHGSSQVANSLLSLFCQQFPDSPLSEFARQQMDDYKSEK